VPLAHPEPLAMEVVHLVDGRGKFLVWRHRTQEVEEHTGVSALSDASHRGDIFSSSHLTFTFLE